MAQGFIDGTHGWDEWEKWPEAVDEWETLPVNGWKEIEEAVRASGRELVECGSDGACFFHSVVRVLEHRLTDVELRNHVVLYMQMHIDSIKARNGDRDDRNKTWEQHIEELSHPKAWVHDQEEIQATAQIIGRNIMCIQFINGVVVPSPIGKAFDNEADLSILIARHNDHYKAVM